MKTLILILTVLFFISGTFYFIGNLEKKETIRWEEYHQVSYENDQLISESLVDLENRLKKITNEAAEDISILDILELREKTPEAFRIRIEKGLIYREDEQRLIEDIRKSLFETIVFGKTIDRYKHLPKLSIIQEYRLALRERPYNEIYRSAQQELEQYP